MSDPVSRQLAKVPPLVWVGIALAAGFGVLILHRYNVDPEDTDWLDPGQPSINAEQDMKITWSNVINSARSGGSRAPKPYPAPNLTSWPGSWIGDC
jgi:hypothetical protein